MTSPAPELLARLQEAELPPHLLGFAFHLALAPEPPTTKQLVEELSVTDRTLRGWARDLEPLVERRLRRGSTVFVLHPEKHFRVKRKSDGKPQRCRICGRLVRRQRSGGTGDLCTLHKQLAGRFDTAWWLPAERLFRRGMRSPYAIQAALAREGLVAPLCDYLLHGRVKRMPGLITRGRRAGYLGPEWDDVQRGLLAGDEAL